MAQNLNLTSLLEGNAFGSTLDFIPKSPETRVIADNLKDSVVRLQATILLPVDMSRLSTAEREAGLRALFETTGGLDIESFRTDKPTEYLRSFATHFQRLVYRSRSQEEESESRIAFMHLVEQNFQLLAHANYVVPWLQSILVNSWTAFEILATDLWVESLNRRPLLLGKEAWKNQDGVPDGKRGEKPIRSFDIDLLSEFGFNLSDKIGSVLKNKRVYAFNKLEDIRDAYSKSFRVSVKDKSGMIPSISSVFSGPDYDKLKLLESLRHVIVHRGGKADDSFLDRVSGLPLFEKIQHGHLIPLDGIIVSECMSIAFNMAARLLSEVDTWLANNKEQ